MQVSRVIPDLIRGLDSAEPPWLAELQEDWASLAGAAESGHARPGRYNDGVLVVFVDGPVWMDELRRYWRPQMLRRLQQRFGKTAIKSLSLQPDPDMPGRRDR